MCYGGYDGFFIQIMGADMYIEYQVTVAQQLFLFLICFKLRVYTYPFYS